MLSLGKRPRPYRHQSGYAVIALWVVNSILANISGLRNGGAGVYGNNNGFYNCPSTVRFGSLQVNGPAPPALAFQSVDYGAHYLPPGSPFRASGTTSIPSSLLADLKTRTTSPPISLPTYMTISREMTFFPQTPRYVSGAPDLGFYYPALNVSAAVCILDRGSVTVEPGTAVAVRKDTL